MHRHENNRITIKRKSVWSTMKVTDNSTYWLYTRFTTPFSFLVWCGQFLVPSKFLDRLWGLTLTDSWGTKHSIFCFYLQLNFHFLNLSLKDFQKFLVRALCWRMAGQWKLKVQGVLDRFQSDGAVLLCIAELHRSAWTQILHQMIITAKLLSSIKQNPF